MRTATSRGRLEALDGPTVEADPAAGPCADATEAPEVLIREARRRQRRRRAFFVLTIVAAVGLAAGLATSLSSPPPTHPPSAPGPRARPPAARLVRPTVTKSADGLVSWHGPMHSPRAFGTRFGLYFAWSTTRLGAGSLHGVLARVDPGSGRMRAVRSTSGTATGMVGVHHSLYVVLSSARPKVPRGRLVRMDPTTLRVLRSWPLPAEHAPYSIVAAGGGIWVAAGDHLERLTPASGAVTASLTFEGAASVSLGTNAAGSVLVAAGDIATGAYYLERIDPSTGAVELVTPRRIGTASIGGIVHAALWVGVGYGTMGNARLFSASSLEPVGPGCHTGSATQTCVGGSSPRPDVTGGRLYITTPNAPTRNYCALPTGQPITLLPVDLRHDEVLAFGRASLLFQVTRTTPRTPTISEVRIPTSCR